MNRAGLLALLWLALIGLPAMGQNPGSGNADASKPVAAEKAPAETSSDKKPDTAQKPKKVWTNEDVGSLKGSVSVVGGKNKPQSQSQSTDDEDQEGSDPHTRKVQQYRDAIEQLRAKIGEADARIAQLRNFKADNGTPSGGINPNHEYNMVPPEEQVRQLEARKKELEAKIEDLENQARKEGIDPGELR